jgi:YD repeat-containing protein
MLESLVYPDGSSITYDYYPFGKYRSATNQYGSVTAYEYDADHRLMKVIFPSGRTLTFSYDSGNNVVKWDDSVLGSGTFAYDALNRITGIAGGDMSHTYTYDAVGNRLTREDEHGGTAYGYDVLNRLATIVHPDGTTTTHDPPLRNLGEVTSLNSIIFLYNSRQNTGLLSLLAAFSPEEIVKNMQFYLQFNHLMVGVHTRVETGQPAFASPFLESPSVSQVAKLMDFLGIYKRLGW